MSEAGDAPGSGSSSPPPLPPRIPARRTSVLDMVIRFCIENKLVVALVVLFALAWGVMVAPFDWQLGKLERSPVPTDAIPDIGENQQIVFTRWMGRSPQDVEDQITYPLTVALLGIPEVRTIRSYSMFGFSTIYVIFREKADFYWSRSRVLEKLNSLPAGTLPAGVQPMLGPDATALGQIFWYTLEGRDPDGNPAGGWNLQELRTIQDWYVRFDLASVPGISEVASVGGFVQEYQIDVDPDAMRAHGVTLQQVFQAVRMSNVDVGARTIEINRVEYIIRGLGFIKSIEDIENTVVKVSDNVPLCIKDVAKVSKGPALRRGALDKEGAEAVGAVAVVRYGYNPLKAINNLKDKIRKIKDGLPKKAVMDFKKATRAEVDALAREHGFTAYAGAVLNQKAWLGWLARTDRKDWPDWITTSQVTIVPFYDRTGLIYETLGTLNTALTEEILVTIIVVLVSVLHLRSSLLISSSLPLAVLVCFIAMKSFGVDANIVALSGIAIAIGTIVDMGIIVCENILRHLDEAGPGESRLEVIFRGASEVGGAVLTAVSTTVVSFLPVFTMTGAEGKLFRPLAFTKTFALVASVIIALTVVPAAAHLLFTWKISSRILRKFFFGGLAAAGLALIVSLGWWLAGSALVLTGAYYLSKDYLPERVSRLGPLAATIVAVVTVGIVLARHWMPLGPEKGFVRNFAFVVILIGGLLLFFRLFQRVYGALLRWFLVHKFVFMLIPLVVLLFGAYAWLGPGIVLGPVEKASPRSFADRADIKKLVELGLAEERDVALVWTAAARDLKPGELRAKISTLRTKRPEAVLADWSRGRKKVAEGTFSGRADAVRLVEDGLLEERTGTVLWTSRATSLDAEDFRAILASLAVKDADKVFEDWSDTKALVDLRSRHWGKPDDPDPDAVRYQPLETRIKWHLLRDWDGLGKEFMPPLDEGSYLLMPTMMPHASIGEALDALRKQDMAIRSIPEVDMVVGKIGRVDSPLDPAPVSMVETIISYRPEYITDKGGRRVRFAYDAARREFVRKSNGDLVPRKDRAGGPVVHADGSPVSDLSWRPYRQWREHIKSPDDIWREIVAAARIPGSTSAPKLQPIAARLVMLQSGMRAPMGVKIKGDDLAKIEQVGLQIEKLLKQVPSVEPATVVADRIVGKPYLVIDIDRKAIARYGIHVRKVQDVIEVAIGGRKITTTVERRERYPVRVRYLRELRDQIETLGKVLVPARDGTQVPMTEVATIRYVRGPQAVKGEDTRLVGYVVFDKKPGFAEVDVVEECQRYLQAKRDSGELNPPDGVTYEFAGNYENQLRAQRKLSIVLPVALFFIFIILYFQFKSVPTTLLVFSGIGVAWAGGFLLIWLYNQPGFLDFSVFGVNLRELFQMPAVNAATGEVTTRINLSVAVWVGFLALFGIASDNGVVIATYLDQSFAKQEVGSVQDVRDATVAGAVRRIRPCLMTSATTILALIPVLTSTGRGSDVMVPMAIPSFGGMLVVLVSVFVVPVLYCLFGEFKRHTGIGDGWLGLLLFATGMLAVVPMMMYCWIRERGRGQEERRGGGRRNSEKFPTGSLDSSG